MYFGEENELKFLFRTSSVAVTTYVRVYATDRIKRILQGISVHCAKSVSALPRGSTWAGFVVTYGM